jgi:hypothetical protein
MSEIFTSGDHFFFPGFFWDQYGYNIGRQKLTFDFQSDEEAAAWELPGNADADYPRLKLAAGKEGGQQVWLGGSIVYKIGHRSVEGNPVIAPDLLAALHNSGNRKNYRSVIIKRVWHQVVQSIVNDEDNPREALDIYSGVGFERFRKDVDEALRNHPAYQAAGIYIESTIMYPVRLDPAYEEEIAGKQLATQTKLKEKELALAADETAKKITSLKQADVNAASQEAEANKVKEFKKAEAARYKEEQAASAERFRKEEDSKGVLALKLAEAEGQRKLTEAMYGGTAGARRYKVEVATNQAKQLHGMLAGVKVITDKALVQLTDDPTGGAVKVTVPAGE